MNVQNRPDKTDLLALESYFSYLAFEWWIKRVEDDAICDRCNSSLKRKEGFLVGSNLYCGDCLKERVLVETTLFELQKNPDYVGVGVLNAARKYYYKNLCHVCSADIADREVYLLNLEEIVTSNKFWDKTIPYGASEGEMNEIIQAVTLRDNPWLICEECINLFSIDKSEGRDRVLQLYEEGGNYSPRGFGGVYKINLSFDYPKPFIKSIRVCKMCSGRSPNSFFEFTCDKCGHTDWRKMFLMPIAIIFLGFIGAKLITGDSIPLRVIGWPMSIINGVICLIWFYLLFEGVKGLIFRMRNKNQGTK